MRVLVADDHDLVRESIGAVMQHNGFEQIKLADSLPGAVDIVKAGNKFDLVLLDYDMPGMNGLEGLSYMLSLVGKTPVALISGMATSEIAGRALKIGAAGYIPKTLSSQSMISALRLMISGESYAPVEFFQNLQDKTDTALSKRETEVLRGICEGKSNKEIARDLELQEVTVKLHVKTLSRKLKARNRTHAAMIARDLALL